MVTSYPDTDAVISASRPRVPVCDDKALRELRTRFGRLWPAIEATIVSIQDPAELAQLLRRIAAPPPQ